jgi:hypothetical protein
MSDAMSREFLAERDLMILQMKKAGASESEIAKRFRISIGAVKSALQRQLEQLNRQAMLAYPEVLRMELERLDSLQKALWPLTQMRRVTTDDGSEVTLEPDIRATQQVLAIMASRAKLMGLEQASKMDIRVDVPQVNTPQLHGAQQAESITAFSPENEARQLLKLMIQAGVMDDSAEHLLELEAPADVEDAEIVEQVEQEET